MSQFNKKGEQLLKNTAIYTVSSFGSKILTFLIIPLYSYYLTTAEFGTYDFVISIINLLTPLCMIAIHEGLLRWLLKSNEDHDEILFTGLSYYASFLLVSCFACGLIFAFWHWEYAIHFVLLLLTSSLHTVTQFIARGEKKNLVFAVSGIIYTIVMLACNLLFVIVFRWGVSGMLWSIIAGNAISAVYVMLCLGKKTFLPKPKSNHKLGKDMLRYSALLVPNNISWWVMNASNRLLITLMISESANGIFAMANKFPSIITILHGIFYQAWQEQAVLEYEEESRDAYYTSVFRTYMKLACCAVLGLIPVTKFIIVHFMDESYLSAYQYIGLMYISALFLSFGGMFGTGYIAAKDTKGAMRTTIVGAVINVAILAALLPFIGLWAACIGTAASYLVVWIIRVVQTRKYFTVKIDWKAFLVLMSLIVVFAVLSCFSNDFVTLVMVAIALVIAVIVNRYWLTAMMKKIMKRS